MAPAAATDSVFRVLDAFSFDHEGVTYVMRRGDIVDGANPAYRGREVLFEEVSAEVVREQQVARSSIGAVETAMAPPGQRRQMAQVPNVADAAPSGPPPAPAPAPLAQVPTPDDSVHDVPAPDPAPAPTTATSKARPARRVVKDQPQA